jgi:predicted amino acid dehydrogenase
LAATLTLGMSASVTDDALVRLQARTELETELHIHATLAALTVVALFRNMPRSSSKFGRDLQAALVPMLNKPSNSVSVRTLGLCKPEQS